MERKIILHLCADLGSDSYFYQLDDSYEVILIAKNIYLIIYLISFQFYNLLERL